MKEQLVNFETAILAKEKGFDEPCPTGAYGKYENKIHVWMQLKNSLIPKYESLGNDETGPSAPMQSLLQKWLREKHNIHVYPIIEMIVLNAPLYIVSIIIKDNNAEYGITRIGYITGFRSYEQALEAGLLEGLKLIKL